MLPLSTSCSFLRSHVSFVNLFPSLFVFISGTMRFSRHGLGASSPLVTTPQYQSITFAMVHLWLQVHTKASPTLLCSRGHFPRVRLDQVVHTAVSAQSFSFSLARPPHVCSNVRYHAVADTAMESCWWVDSNALFNLNDGNSNENLCVCSNHSEHCVHVYVV
jgi:hypothetical protein